MAIYLFILYICSSHSPEKDCQGCNPTTAGTESSHPAKWYIAIGLAVKTIGRLMDSSQKENTFFLKKADFSEAVSPLDLTYPQQRKT